MMIKGLASLVALIAVATACSSDRAPTKDSQPTASPARFRVVLLEVPTTQQPAPRAPGSTGSTPAAVEPSPLKCPAPRRDVREGEPLKACSTDGKQHYQLGPARLSAKDISRVVLSRSDLDQPLLTIHFTQDGQRAFTALTREIVGRQLALEVDGVVLSAPFIHDVIEKEAVLSGFDEQKARALLDRLGVGA